MWQKYHQMWEICGQMWCRYCLIWQWNHQMWEREGDHQMWQKYNHIWCWYRTIWEWHCQMWEKIKVQLNMRKIQSNVILVLPNVTIELSNVRKREEDHQMWQKYSHMGCWCCTIWGWHHQMWKKIKVQLNIKKIQSNVMLVLPNVTIEPTFMRKKIESPNVTKV